MDNEILKLKCDEDNRQTLQWLNLVELWLNTYALYLEIRNKHLLND